MTKAQRLKDEQVLAAIIAGAKGDGRKVRRGDWGVYADYDTDVSKVASGPVCAVGAGCLFAGLRMIDGVSVSVIDEFATAHGVSRAYACGVSDGFENIAIENYGDFHPGKQEEYERGVAVGAAAGLALNPRGLHCA